MNGRQVGELCGALSGRVRTLKVGLQLFIAEGPSIVGDVRKAGFDVFLDLKLHDIPHQVGLACKAIAAMGVSMLTVHVSGGEAMLRAAVEGAGKAARERGNAAPKVVGVTVLTSLDENDLATMGITAKPVEQVAALAAVALRSGLDGVVASPREVPVLRSRLGEDFLVVTPGIRPAHAAAGDQKRTMTPAEAIAFGASHLVVGRPITGADDPASALEAIRVDLA